MCEISCLGKIKINFWVFILRYNLFKYNLCVVRVSQPSYWGCVFNGFSSTKKELSVWKYSFINYIGQFSGICQMKSTFIKYPLHFVFIPRKTHTQYSRLYMTWISVGSQFHFTFWNLNSGQKTFIRKLIYRKVILCWCVCVRLQQQQLQPRR